MKFQVPSEKDIKFAQDLFSLISENISDLEIENEKVPNKIIFTGNIGKEVFDFIQEKNWNFKGFELESVSSVLNALVFKYSAPVTLTGGQMSTQFEGGTLHGREINGIPGPETTRKIISSYAMPSYTIERTVRPEKRILLIRR